MVDEFRGGLRILMVDDSADDRMFVKRALDRSGVGASFIGVDDGEAAIRYLQAKGEYADRAKFPVPNLVLCDLKMARVDGFEFLVWLKDHSDCSIIPTIIFSSSAMEGDVRKAYQLGANAFVTKPHDIEELTELIQATYKFWALCERSPVPAKC